MRLSSLLENMLNREDTSTNTGGDDVSVLGNNSIGRLLMDTRIEGNNNDERSMIDFALDDINDITYGRRIARYLMKYSWYNPQVKKDSNAMRDMNDSGEDNNDEGSSTLTPLLLSMNVQQKQQQQQQRQIAGLDVDKAWAFFEHFSLPRYIYQGSEGEDGDGSQLLRFDRAEPGENDVATKLYDPIRTPLDQMGDFGIGIGLYFSALKYLVILTLICGILSMPSIFYYASLTYSESQSGVSSFFLKGSAICTDTEWVPCPTCEKSDFKHAELRIRYEDDDSRTTEALKNKCDAPPISIGVIQWFMIVSVCVGFYVIQSKQTEMQIVFDEDEQTAQDYSIHIHNPPDDAIDPEEWNTFLLQFGHVTCCTLCVNNDVLVQSLVERRERYQQMKRRFLKPGTSLDDDTLSKIAAEIETRHRFCKVFLNEFLLYPLGIYNLTGLHQRIAVLNEKIRGLVQLSYPVTNVFITFETEQGQRDCLTALSVGKYYSRTNIIPHTFSNHFLF